jgi:hypothetical protein
MDRQVLSVTNYKERPEAVTLTLVCGHELHALAESFSKIQDCKECDLLKGGGWIERKHRRKQTVVTETWNPELEMPRRIITPLPEELR